MFSDLLTSGFCPIVHRRTSASASFLAVEVMNQNQTQRSRQASTFSAEITPVNSGAATPISPLSAQNSYTNLFASRSSSYSVIKPGKAYVKGELSRQTSVSGSTEDLKGGTACVTPIQSPSSSSLFHDSSKKNFVSSVSCRKARLSLIVAELCQSQ